MRILMFNNEFPPLGGGTGVINYNLLRELTEFPDVVVDLITTSAHAIYEEEQLGANVTCYKLPIRVNNVHHATLLELIKYSVKGLCFARTLAKKHQYDFTFAYSTVPAGGISFALKLTNGLPYIISLQGPDIPGFEVRYKLIYPLLAPIIKLIWKHADIVTAQSVLQCDLAHKTTAKLEIPIIPNGVNLDRFRVNRPAVAAKGKEVRILTAARLIERKRVDNVIKALAELHKRHPDVPVQLLIAGTGDERENLENLAKSLGLNNQVRFLGIVPRDEMPEAYRDADIFIQPSDHEGMSIALLESLASGLPAIVTEVGGTEELVRDGENGIVLSSSEVENILGALEKLVLNDELRIQMGQKSRLCAERFSWATMTESHVSMFKEMMQRKGNSVRQELHSAERI